MTVRCFNRGSSLSFNVLQILYLFKIGQNYRFLFLFGALLLITKLKKKKKTGRLQDLNRLFFFSLEFYFKTYKLFNLKRYLFI